jgi:hypothetical protein
MNIKQRLEALEISHPVSNGIVRTAAALERLIDNGDLVFAAGQFLAGDDAHDRMDVLANLLNVAKERWERDQQ